jgi:gluconate 2-dehydrogenase gamma chain
MGIEKNSDPKNAGPEGPAESRGVLNRRDVLKAVSAVPAAFIPLASAKGASIGMPKTSSASAAPVAGSYKPKTLTEHEWETVRALSDLILPADERSGSATQAGVPEFIDHWLGFRGGTLLAEIRGGLTWLDMECHRLFSRDLAACSPAEQKQILDRIAYPRKAAPEDANAVAFFNKLRDLVVSGFYTSEMGIKDLPYLGNKRVAEWKGCPPDVLARLHVKYEDS